MDMRPLIRDPLLVHLNTLDQAWRQQQPIDLRQFIRQLDRTITVEQQADLLAADLEWRWRSAGFAFRPEWEQDDAQAVFEGPQPKSVEQYTSEFPQLRDSAKALRLLVEAEFIARSRWHTPPLIKPFALRFATLGDLQPLLLAALDEVAPLLVTLKDTAGYLERFQAAADVVLGRGAPDEPLGFAVRPGPADRPEFADCPGRDDRPELFNTAGPERLVIAEAHQSNVSRTQARWTRLSLDQLRIENTSRNVVMRVAGRKLLPGDACSDYLPLSIRIPPLRLGLELAI